MLITCDRAFYAIKHEHLCKLMSYIDRVTAESFIPQISETEDRYLSTMELLLCGFEQITLI